MRKGRGGLGSYGGEQADGGIPEGGVGFEGGDEEEGGVGDEQESRDNNLCRGG